MNSRTMAHGAIVWLALAPVSYLLSVDGFLIYMAPFPAYLIALLGKRREERREALEEWREEGSA